MKGPFGPGTGGPPVSGNLASHDLLRGDGTVIGVFEYDAGFFMHHHPDPADPLLHVLATVSLADLLADIAADGNIDQLAGDDTVFIYTLIVGRPDTPCRFQAARQARDEDFDIIAAGDRTNDRGLEFHQVDLSKPGVHQRFYCAEIQDDVGALFNSFAATGGVLQYEQSHFLLNSVRPQ